MSKITVYRASPYVIEKKSSHQSTKKNISISFAELRSWVKSGKIFSHLFRYKDSVMVSHDLKLIAKPFASAVLMRVLARNKTFRQDKKGLSQQITLSLIFSLLSRLLKDFFLKGKCLKNIQEELILLQSCIKHRNNQSLDLTLPPVYLRTDFCFGLQSGGSVGHIAGVLNNLNQFTAPPIFLTTDSIPTVNSDLESHIITPGDAFWDFTEMPPLHFNSVFLEKAKKILGTRRPSFIYQRYSINNYSGVQLAKFYNVPFVLEFNGSEIWVSRHWGNHSLKYEKIAEQIESLNLKSADLIVVVSQPLKDQLAASGINPEKILVNPNGVNPDVYSPYVDGAQIRQKHHLDNKIVLGFIGTFGMWHGAEVLTEAFGMLLESYPELRNTVRLLLIGDGTTMQLVKEKLFQWKIEDFVILTGTIPQEEGPAYLAACDILVAPHIPNADGTPFFGSPTKLFEYMAMGKGIVASDLDQIGEILKHGKTAWMVKPGDSTSLMKGLKALIDDSPTRQRLGQAAREEVVRMYSWKEHTRKIIDYMSRLYGR